MWWLCWWPSGDTFVFQHSALAHSTEYWLVHSSLHWRHFGDSGTSGLHSTAFHSPRSMAAEQFQHEFGGLQRVGVLQERMYHMQILDTDDLKQCLIAAWSGLEQRVIDETINQWRGRLHTCVTADVRHFEQLLWADDVFLCYLVTVWFYCLTMKRHRVWRTLNLLLALQGTIV